MLAADYIDLDAPYLAQFDAILWFAGHAPWNEQQLQRKMQIKSRVPKSDIDRGWGHHHFRTSEDLQAEFAKVRASATNLMRHPTLGGALRRHLAPAE